MGQLGEAFAQQGHEVGTCHGVGSASEGGVWQIDVTCEGLANCNNGHRAGEAGWPWEELGTGQADRPWMPMCLLQLVSRTQAG